jgi:hypothetical protein
VDGYEQLRQRALAGDLTGWRMGLAVLQHRGVAAWLRVRQSVASGGAPAADEAARAAPGPVPAGVGGQLVAVLAGMALGAAAGRG